LKDKHLVGAGPILDPETGENFALQVLKLRALSGAGGLLLIIELARAGYDEADLALRQLAQELMHRKQCPVMLEAYAQEVLPKPWRRKQGRRKSTNLLQDVMFASLMADLVHKFGVRPTRRRDPRHDHSACDILVMAVSEAKSLKRSFNYKDAERLWGQWGNWVRSGVPI
jgi:hypothetical protein